jgi:spermidine/putrescine-binding protein
MHDNTDPSVSADMSPSDQQLTRRGLLRRGVAASIALSTPGFLTVGTGVGRSATAAQLAEDARKTIVFINFPSFIGPHEIADFQRANPTVRVKQVTSLYQGGSVYQQIVQNRGAYDFLLADVTLAEQMRAGRVLAPLNRSKIPNLGLVAPQFRKAFPLGCPTDYGRVGIAYRKDLVPKPPRSLKELWAIAPQYSRKLLFVSFDRAILAATLLSLGLNPNSTRTADLGKVKTALLQIKPHIKAFPTFCGDSLAKGQAAIALTLDYDAAIGQRENRKVGWILPAEGSVGYVDGLVAVAGSKDLDDVFRFMNFHLSPRNYASFLNAVGLGPVMKAAVPYLKPAIAKSPIIHYNPSYLKGVTVFKYLGAKVMKEYSRVWEEVQG